VQYTSWRREEPAFCPTDSVILDTCGHWTNLAAEIIARRLPAAAVIDLGRW